MYKIEIQCHDSDHKTYIDTPSVDLRYKTIAEGLEAAKTMAMDECDSHNESYPESLETMHWNVCEVENPEEPYEVEVKILDAKNNEITRVTKYSVIGEHTNNWSYGYNEHNKSVTVYTGSGCSVCEISGIKNENAALEMFLEVCAEYEED